MTDRRIRKTCSVSWDSLTKTTNCDIRFCTNCQKSVHDISKLEKGEIEELYNQSNGKLCVRMLDTNKSRKVISINFKYFNHTIKTIGKIGLLMSGLLMGQNMYSQSKITKYEISQVETKSETIIISGKILGKKKIGWRNMKEVEIHVRSKDIDLGTYKTNSKGYFVIELEKDRFVDKFSVSIVSSKYRELHINNIELKNTSFEIFLREKIGFYITGRYF